MSGNVLSQRKRQVRIVVALFISLLLAVGAVHILAGCGGEGEKVVIVDEDSDRENGEDIEKEEEEDIEEDFDGEPVELGMEYENDKYYFGISFPEGWECEEILNGDGCSITDPDHEQWEVLAWAEPAQGKTPEEYVEEYYTMMSTAFETEREDSSFETGTFYDEDYAYDYWTRYVPVDDAYSYYEIFVVERDNKFFIVTADYPVDETEEAEPVMLEIMDSLVLPDREAK